MDYKNILVDLGYSFPDKFISLGEKTVLASNSQSNPLTGSYTVLVKQETFTAAYVAFSSKAVLEVRPMGKSPYGPQADFVSRKVLAVLDDSVSDAATAINGDYKKIADAQMAAYRAKFADAIADSTKAAIDLTKKKDDDLLLDVFQNMDSLF